MYSNNQKISSRQTFRLFLFDFLGISTLVLPSLLAEEAGVYATLGILLSGLLGGVYLFYLIYCGKHMKTDLLSVIGNENRGRQIKWLVGILLFICNVVSGGFALAILVGMVKQSLIKEASFSFLLILTLCVCQYAISGGLESRARVYEVLFWFVLTPLFFMLFLSVRDIEFSYYQGNEMADGYAICKTAYMSFLCFGSMFSVLYFPGKLNVKEEKQWDCMKKSVGMAFFISVGILMLVYLVLIGVFGENALKTMRYPVVTLMSTIQFQGSFVKRLDALMLAVWFFTMLALINQNLFYAGKVADCFLKKQKKGTGQLVAWVLCAVVGLLIGYFPNLWESFVWFFWYVQMPAYFVLPLLFAFTSKKGRKKTGVVLGSLLLLSLNACASVELEKKSFPLIAVVSKDADSFSIVYEPYKESTSLDYNHVKVMIFEEAILKDDKLYKESLQFLKGEETYPRNVYVGVTKNGKKFLEASDLMAEDLGEHTEQVLLHKAKEEKLQLVTLGKLMDELENNTLQLELPVLVVYKDKISWEGFYCIENSIPLYKVSGSGKNEE